MFLLRFRFDKNWETCTKLRETVHQIWQAEIFATSTETLGSRIGNWAMLTGRQAIDAYFGPQWLEWVID